MKLTPKNFKSLISFFILFSLLTNSCKKEKEPEAQKNTFSYGGKTTFFNVELSQTKFMDHECYTFGSMGQISNIKTPGMRLYFYDNEIILYLDLFGENVGKYSNISGFCKDFQFKSGSLWKSMDGRRVGFIGSDSEIEITKRANSQISGNFKIRVEFDKDFINDSFVVGKFENVPLLEKL